MKKLIVIILFLTTASSIKSQELVVSDEVRYFYHDIAVNGYWMGSQYVTEIIEIIHCDDPGDDCYIGEIVAE